LKSEIAIENILRRTAWILCIRAAKHCGKVKMIMMLTILA